MFELATPTYSGRKLTLTTCAGSCRNGLMAYSYDHSDLSGKEHECVRSFRHRVKKVWSRECTFCSAHAQ